MVYQKQNIMQIILIFTHFAVLYSLVHLHYSLHFFFTVLAERCYSNLQLKGVIAGNAFWDTVTSQLSAGNGKVSSL